MGRGKGGSTSHGKRTPGGIRTSSKMSKVGEIEAKHGVLGEDAGAPERISAASNKVDWNARTAEFKEKISGYDKDRRVQLETFWNKYVKAAKGGANIDEPDPEVLSNDIDRWLLQSKRLQSQRQRAKKAGVEVDLPALPSLEKYNHVELNKAMADYKTVAEEQAEQQELEKSGASLLYDDGEFKTFAITHPAALTKLAQETSWCTKDAETAEMKVKGHDYRIVTRNGQPIFAIKLPKRSAYSFEVLSRADFEMVHGVGQMLSDGHKKQPIVKEEYDYLQKVLKKLKAPEFDDRHIQVIDEKEKHLTLNEALIGLSADPEFDFVSLGIDSISDERVREAMTDDSEVGAAYIKAAKRGLSRFEDTIAQNKNLIVAYAETLSSRFPKKYREAAEAELIGDPFACYRYAQAYKGRFEAGEESIASERTSALNYSYLHGNRFPGKYRRKAENVLATDITTAAFYAKMNGGRFPGDYPEAQKRAELVIAGKPAAALDYAENNGGRFPDDHEGVREKAEGEIAKSLPEHTYAYAEMNGGRFPGDYPEIQRRAEYNIAQSLYYALQYAALNGGRFPSDHPDVQRYIESKIANFPEKILIYTQLNGGKFPGVFREQAEQTIRKDARAMAEYEQLTGVKLK